jgi:hypothetical protein
VRGKKLMMKCPHCGGNRYPNDGSCRICGCTLPGLEIVDEDYINQNVKATQPKFNKLCLAGFIVSLSSIFFSFAGWTITSVFSGEKAATITFAFCAINGILCFLSGLIISIIGVRSAGRKGERGRAFGIAGIISACAGAAANIIYVVVSFALIVAYLLALVSMGFRGSAPPPDDYPVFTETTETSGYETFYPEELYEPRETATYGSGPKKIVIWTNSYEEFESDIPGQFIKIHPEFGDKYTIEYTFINGGDEEYQKALNEAVGSSFMEQPDIYFVSPYWTSYVKGDMSKYAATYKELGIDVDNKIKEADIESNVVDLGVRDGEVVGLGYRSNTCVMIYRASIAREVFGTDDPSEIEKIVGGGSGSWDKFFKAAEKLNEKGYAAVSGPEDILFTNQDSKGSPWIKDGQLVIDPQKEKELDLAKKICDKKWSNDTEYWDDNWNADLNGTGARQTFAFFGPTWLLDLYKHRASVDDYTGLATYGDFRVCVPPVGFGTCGYLMLVNKNTTGKDPDLASGVAELVEWYTLDTTETGFQYLWASGTVDWDNNSYTVTEKDTVVSNTVMAMLKNESDVCGGQDINPVFIAASRKASANHISEYDDPIEGIWRDVVLEYAHGNLSKNEAIEKFRKRVNDEVPFDQ